MVLKDDEYDMTSVMELYSIYNRNGIVKNLSIIGKEKDWTESYYTILEDKLIIDGELTINKLDNKELRLSKTENGITCFMYFEKIN